MASELNPDDYIIARKRKMYKFAKFHNAKNCYEIEQWKKQPVDAIELGAGTGLFSVELAARHPDKQYLAVDVKADRLQKGAYEALERGIENIAFIRARADQIEELTQQASVQTIWLTFPDPFPRAHSERRRMTHPIYLERYARLLRPSGRFILKHDNDAFFQWSLEQLVSQRWQLKDLAFDLHASASSEEFKIFTTYETRWLSEGRVTKLVSAKNPT